MSKGKDTNKRMKNHPPFEDENYLHNEEHF
jgi:hypothetical protein